MLQQIHPASQRAQSKPEKMIPVREADSFEAASWGDADTGANLTLHLPKFLSVRPRNCKASNPDQQQMDSPRLWLCEHNTNQRCPREAWDSDWTRLLKNPKSHRTGSPKGTHQMGSTAPQIWLFPAICTSATEPALPLGGQVYMDQGRR